MRSRNLIILLYLLTIAFSYLLFRFLVLEEFTSLLNLSDQLKDLKLQNQQAKNQQINLVSLNSQIDSLNNLLLDEKIKNTVKHSDIFMKINKTASKASIRIISVNTDQKAFLPESYVLLPEGSFVNVCRFINDIEVGIPNLYIDKTSFSLLDDQFMSEIRFHIIKVD